MSINIAQLEQAWLQAETMADVAKREALRASDELQVRNAKVVDAAEVKILMSTVEQARSRQADAERRASAAFDLLWQAKGQGQQSLHA
jgi:hypothetical protein